MNKVMDVVDDPVVPVKGVVDAVRLAIVRAVAKGAASANEPEECQALADLTHAFHMLGGKSKGPGGPHPGHGHGSPGHGEPGNPHNIAPLPPDLQDHLDELTEAAGLGELEPGETAEKFDSPGAPEPLTPAQMKLRRAVEDAGLALIDALARLAKKPLVNSTCLKLLVNAFCNLPLTVGSAPPRPPGGHGH